MNPGIRNIVFVLALSCFGGLFMWGLLGLDPRGRLPRPLWRHPERNFRARAAHHRRGHGGELRFSGFRYPGRRVHYVQFGDGCVGSATSRAGWRREKDQSPRRHVAPVSDAVRVLTVLLVGPVVLFGIYMVTHGQLSPGGGFQGGVFLATAPLLVYLAGEFKKLMKIAPHHLLEIGEAVGAAGYAVVGAVALASGLPFLQNVLPLGKPGDVVSGGTVVFIDVTVGLEVAAGFILLLMTFLEEEIQQKEPN